ncbi:cbb3-type cytochrome oxidase assembly protein CcoS [Lutibacter maritimus]|uniref:Cytochrome oxidase maturation protein, cbb3-type n=1 Tax=Lutibacter maritimus TaxID=593133 RepID=A0A1I6NT17_9FLAO|nr:cbb3-type cytochrome oxidase assembly protein CcoS [Lutibacter maritimus]SFS31092.1 cytochrome oxidase maturation protein, cbb3-type [Lutibacter maritimus]
MEVVYITIGVSIIVAIFFFIIFIKSVKSGQYEDTYTPSVRMLFDDELVTEKNKDKHKDTEKKSQSTKNK